MKRRKHYKKILGYKVVRKEGRELLSAIDMSEVAPTPASDQRKDINVRYKIGAVAHPRKAARGTLLFAFKGILDARRYQRMAGGRRRIYRCVCLDCYEDSALSYVVSLAEARLFFRNPGAEGIWSIATDRFGTTLLSKGIKLLRRVK